MGHEFHVATLPLAFVIIPNPHLNQAPEPAAHLKILSAEKHFSQGSFSRCPGECLNLGHSQGLKTEL